MGLEHFYDWFVLLSTTRQTGYEVMPLSINEIRKFAGDLKLDADERDEFEYFMMAMDNAFRDWNEKEVARKKT